MTNSSIILLECLVNQGQVIRPIVYIWLDDFLMFRIEPGEAIRNLYLPFFTGILC